MESKKVLFEGCVDNIKDAITLIQNKVDRLELCSNLDAAGLTPELMLVDFCHNACKVNSVVMLRLRDDFIWKETDLKEYEKSIEEFKSIGINQFIFGFIKDGEIDIEACKKLIKLMGGCEYTFHMAIDSTNNIAQSIETLITLGFTRVLTKGGNGCAMDNLEVIKNLVSRYGEQIEILVGGKVTKDNWKAIQEQTGANQFHGRKIL